MNAGNLRKQVLRKELALFDERYALLGYDLSRQADPSVERLLEGFCYLTQHLDAFVEASSPAIALRLLNILWPDVLCDIPAMSVASIAPANHPVFLPKNSLLSSEIGNYRRLRFSSMLDGTVLPLKIDSTIIESGKISVNFKVQGSCDPGHLEKILFYVDPQADELYNLFYMLVKCLQSMTLRVAGQDLVLPATCFPVAFQESVEDPFVLINHFFQCPRQFLFFEIQSLHRYVPVSFEGFSLLFECQETIKIDLPMPTLLHLNCLPVMNRFSQACEPMSVSQEQDAYLLSSSDQEDAVGIIEVTELSAKTLSGVSVTLCNPYKHALASLAVSYVLHKMEEGFQLLLDVRAVQGPLIISAQAWVHQPEQCRQFHWKTARLTAEAGQVEGRLLEKLSLPVEQPSRDCPALLAVLQSKIRVKMSVSELQFLLTTLLCRHSPKALRMIAGIAAFSGRAVFQLHSGSVVEVVVWEIQLERDHFETIASLRQFAGVLERLIALYRPANQRYQFNIVEIS